MKLEEFNNRLESITARATELTSLVVKLKCGDTAVDVNYVIDLIQQSAKNEIALTTMVDDLEQRLNDSSDIDVPEFMNKTES